MGRTRPQTVRRPVPCEFIPTWIGSFLRVLLVVLAAHTQLLQRMGGGERGGRSNASCWLGSSERSAGLCSQQCRQYECNRPVCACLNIFVQRDARPVMSSLRRSSRYAARNWLRCVSLMAAAPASSAQMLAHATKRAVLTRCQRLHSALFPASAGLKAGADFILSEAPSGFAHVRSACIFPSDCSKANDWP